MIMIILHQLTLQVLSKFSNGIKSILWLLIVTLLKVFVLQFIYDAPSSPLM